MTATGSKSSNAFSTYMDDDNGETDAKRRKVDQSGTGLECVICLAKAKDGIPRSRGMGTMTNTLLELSKMVMSAHLDSRI